MAAHLHLDPRRVRRAPLPLVLLWANHAAQADGLETWWTNEEERRSADDLHEHLAALRKSADDIGTEAADE